MNRLLTGVALGLGLAVVTCIAPAHATDSIKVESLRVADGYTFVTFKYTNQNSVALELVMFTCGMLDASGTARDVAEAGAQNVDVGETIYVEAMSEVTGIASAVCRVDHTYE